MDRLKVSIIVPMLNEADRIGAFLEDLSAQPGPKEIIVVDGGSTDGTLARVTGRARRLLAPRGRWIQQNRGACHATGDVLLFVHADCRLPPNALDRIRQAVRRGAVGGAFLICFSEGNRWLRLLDLFRDLRSRLWHEVYGDQAIFVRRRDFEALGGFAPLPVMEDLDLVRRLRRRGRICVLPERVESSPRRFRKNGWIRQFVLNQRIKLAYHLRWNLDRLYR